MNIACKNSAIIKLIFFHGSHERVCRWSTKKTQYAEYLEKLCSWNCKTQKWIASFWCCEFWLWILVHCNFFSQQHEICSVFFKFYQWREILHTLHFMLNKILENECLDKISNESFQLGWKNQYCKNMVCFESFDESNAKK